MKLVISECQNIADDEALPVDAIVDLHIETADSDLSVAKASVSRTLRRMWTRGLIELYSTDESGDMLSLTEAVRYSHEQLALIESNPVAFFRQETAGLDPADTWKNPREMLAEYRNEYGGEFPRWFRTRYIALNDQP